MDLDRPREVCIRWEFLIPHAKGAIFRGKNMSGHAQKQSAVRCAKRLNRSRCRSVCGLGVDTRKHALHVDTHWPNVANEIDPSMCGWLNGAAAARPYVKLS